MRNIENNTIPFGTFVAFNYFGLVFIKRLLSAEEENHEAIHTRQQIEWLILYTAVLLVLILGCGWSWWWLCSVPFCFHVILYCVLWFIECRLTTGPIGMSRSNASATTTRRIRCI